MDSSSSSSSTLGLLLATLAVAAPLLYVYAASVVRARLPGLADKRICLLIAHPDDEAMFFAPTVLALTPLALRNHVKILCLSTGNADGLGETRRRELIESGMLLGMRDPEDIFVMDNPDFPDSMTTTWNDAAISSVLCSAFAPKLARPSRPPPSSPSSSNRPEVKIDVLITFDGRGVSRHPNHISLYHGARHFLRALARDDIGRTNHVDLYTLRSVGVVRKYMGLFDVFTTVLAWAWATAATAAGGTSRGTRSTRQRQQQQQHPTRLLFMNQLVGDGALPTAWAAMTSAHKSQMVWFRYFWITLSRYMVINDLQLESVDG
ncbi:N-acetylglucosaminyl-phosphatidylinositol de-N-acetylase [Moelleriella libera RCEF 2490]|uniref:N-acetylglucosaminylphosphatidylinositol deacetylase n=1 Tax=Moelleriella libera RCEF 2490 TaxID=1081109 RepID=A0A168F4U2_9HYPO|nr:N-acetylglucosaminyl-phosphatidylinositol de-N-acetylase [Moelleriella libera RCEF 2490]